MTPFIRLSLPIVLVLLISAATARAQNCPPATFDFSTVRTLNATVSACSDAQTFLHFISSRGSYGSALTFPLQDKQGNVQVPNSCALTPYRNAGFNTLDACLKFTGECGSQLGGISACRADSQTQSGEISCQCQSSPVFGPLSWKAGESFQVEPMLYVDADLDRLADNSFWGDARVTGKRMLYWTQWWESSVTMNWEDNWKEASSDFNDYVATLEVKQCTPERFPPQVVKTQDVSCVDPCGNNACSEELLKNSIERVRFAAGVTFDEKVSEIPYEKNGRRVQLTIFGYDDFDQLLLKSRTRTVAVCPVLNMSWMRPRLPNEQHDLTTLLRYGDAQCTTKSSDLSGSPICAGVELEGTFPISFAIEQTSSPNCGNPPGIADVVGTTPSPPCAANSFVRHYEMSLEKIDWQFSDPSLHLNVERFSTLEGKVESVDVYVFSDIQTPAFQCPSGANARFDAVAPDVAKVVKYHLTVGAELNVKRTGR